MTGITMLQPILASSLIALTVSVFTYITLSTHPSLLNPQDDHCCPVSPVWKPKDREVPILFKDTGK